MKNKYDSLSKKISFLTFIVSIFLFISSMPMVQPDDEGDLKITMVEIIQVIENPKAIIMNKAAAIRVNISSTFPDRVYTKVNVIYNFGDDSYLEEGYDKEGIPIEPGENTLYIPGGPVFPGDDEPWIFPDTPPFLIWDKDGIDNFVSCTVDPLNELEEINEENNEHGTNGYIEVLESETLRFLIIPIVFNDPDAVSWSVDDTIIEKEYDYMLSIYPLAPENLIFEERSTWYCRYSPVYVPGTINMDRDWLYEYVAHPLSIEARIAGYDRAIIVIDEHFGPLGVACGMLREPEDRIPILCRSHFSTFPLGHQTLQESLIAHEIGHTYYLWHPHDIGPDVFNSKKFDVEAREYAGRYDYLPTVMSYRSEPRWIDKGRYDSDIKVWHPPGHYEFPGDPWYGIPVYEDDFLVGTWGWNLVDQLAGEEFPRLVATISGIFTLDEDSNEVIISDIPWFIFEGDPDTLDPPKEPTHFIKLITPKKEESIPIRISFDYVAHPSMYGELKPATTDRIPFCFNIPLIDDTRIIQITDKFGNILIERILTAYAPTVEILTPNGGETIIVGDNFEISWSASDSDGDSLTYMIMYSINNGVTWIPIVSELSETKYSWDTSYLNPRKSYLIKVIACDGTNTGSDVSNAFFTVEKNIVSIDIKPGSCPNPLIRNSKGVLPVSICGNEDFDVTQIDPSSIRLMRDGTSGYACPIRWSYKDVATPYIGEDGSCHDFNEDGFIDLNLKFKIQEIVSNLDLCSSEMGIMPISLFGKLKEEYDGTSFQGQDYIWIIM